MTSLMVEFAFDTTTKSDGDVSAFASDYVFESCDTGTGIDGPS